MSREFVIPKVILGENALKKSAEYFKNAGKKAFIVTGKHVSKTEIFDELIDVLEENSLKYHIFSDITGEPTVDMINEGLFEYKASGSDFFIGIGGGSPLDSIKAIATLSVLGGEISDLMGKIIKADLPPMIAIPTTAGTGSEVTKFTIITDSKTDVKMLLRGDDLVPNFAIVDKKATLSCPKSVTVGTGLDALTHAIEAYTSRLSGPLTDTVSLSAIKKIFEFLPKVLDNPNDEEARYQMAIASLEAGIAINNASVTIVHGMSRPIGALFHVPHGISNAMLLPKCMAFAISGNYKKFANIARTIGISGDNDEVLAKNFVKNLEVLCKICEVPTILQYGINKDEFLSKIDKMATDALASGSPQNTVKEVTKEDILKIYTDIL